MAIGPREVMRSEVEGGLSGPANPIPNESLDCGCGQLPCPGLAKFATRRLFVGLLCWIGIVQATAQAYLHITSPTIARRFQFDPILMEWILIVAELTPFVLGVLVAYWGDRIHRAAWTGALVLLQSAAFVALIIPHFTHSTRVIEEPENFTHMSIYAEDNPELCSSGLSRIVVEEDEPCYTTLGLLIGVQILTGMANVAYYALGISYLDDNTKKRHVAGLIGIVIAVKVMGLLLGYILAWGCLRLDSQNLQIIKSYREQMGAWWLGWPILAFFLAIPGLFVSWLPRRLPSEVVEQAAASILDLAGRASPASFEIAESRRVGGTGYFVSLARLFTNKILICKILAAAFCTAALINFAANENIILESRYHVPKPTGILLGFGDPLLSRLIASMMKPMIIGMIIIISGMVITRVRPRGRTLVIYNVVALVLAATIIFSLIFATCEMPPIVGERRGSIALLRYCNKNCRCSKDADFRPVCDSKATFTFYSPCHAGCKTIEQVDNVNIYGQCSCVEEMTGLGNSHAKDGPCGSQACQIGWMIFEVGTLLAYSLAASSLVGCLLMVLRSVKVQDKALAIAFCLTFDTFFIHVPGKLAYTKIAEMTCRHWGRGSICHLHDENTLGDYMCYLTSFFLMLAASFEIVLCFFCGKLRLYGDSVSELPRETELKEVGRNQAVPLLEGTSEASNVPNDEATNNIEKAITIESSSLDLREQKVAEDNHQRSVPLGYGPQGTRDSRPNVAVTNSNDPELTRAKMRHGDTDDELDSSSDEDGVPGRGAQLKILDSSPHVAYRPLELDSDVESDLSSIGPRSRRRVPSGIFDDLPKDEIGNVISPFNKRPFPNPDHYEDPSRVSIGRTPARNGKSLENLKTKPQGGFSRTNSFEFAMNQESRNSIRKSHEGDFNEVGIPVMEPLVAASILTSPGHSRPDDRHQEVNVLLPTYQKQASQERLETIRSLLDSVDERRKHRPENDDLPEGDEDEYSDTPPPIIGRPPSRGQAASGFGSFLVMEERNKTALPLPGLAKTTSTGISRTNSPKSGEPPKGESPKAGPLSTAL